MLAWTGYIRDAATEETLAYLGTLRDVPRIEEHLEHVSGYGYPSRYQGTAGALASWAQTLDAQQFHSELVATPTDAEHPSGRGIARPAEARERALAELSALDPEREVVLDLWDQS